MTTELGRVSVSNGQPDIPAEWVVEWIELSQIFWREFWKHHDESKSLYRVTDERTSPR